MKIVLASGQSNMSGRGLGGPSLDSVSPLVRVWNNTNELGSHGSEFVASPTQGSAPWSQAPLNAGNNLAAWFCDRLAKETGEEVRLILVSKGGSSISHWDPITGDLFEEIEDVWSATGLSTPADIFLWHQGESDASSTQGAYTSAFLAMISALESASILAEDAAKIVGGVRAGAAVVNPWLQSLAAENANIYYADPTGLHDSDGTHFTGNHLFQFGHGRYWDAYCRHIGPVVIAGDPIGFLLFAR